MKKSILILLAAFGLVKVQAQQIPLFTQYYNNEFLYNPSQTLTDDFASVSMFYRKQFVLSQSPLTSQGISFQTPLMADKIGLGVNLINDKFGVFNRTGGSLAYSYRVDLNDDHKVLLGLSAGFLNTNFDWNQDLEVLADPRIQQAVTDRYTNFDATFGFTYAWKGLEVGVAVPNLLASDLDFMSNEEDQLYMNERHFLGSISYEIEMDKIDLRPIALIRYQEAVDPVFDLNLMATYDKKIWAAVGYRHEGAMTFGAGVILHERFLIGYSYDMMLNSDLSEYFGATHELNFKIRLGAVKSKKIIEEEEKVKDSMFNNLEELQKQIRALQKENEDQKEELDSHEIRIQNLENQMMKDSLQKTMETLLDDMKIGSGSYDFRGKTLNMDENARPIVNPGNPEGLFGYKADGTPISPTENYEGDVYYDKEGTRKVEDPNNPQVELYDEEGNRITDLKNHVGRVKDKNGNYVKDADGNYVTYNVDKMEGGVNGPDGPGSPGYNDPRNGGGDYGNQGGDNQGGYNNDRGGVNGGGSRDIPNYSKSELAADGIRYTAPGNYVVVGSFRRKEYSIKMREELQEKGYSAGIVYNHYRRWFYVYSTETDNFDQALSTMVSERTKGHDDAWVHVIIE